MQMLVARRNLFPVAALLAVAGSWTGGMANDDDGDNNKHNNQISISPSEALFEIGL